MSRDEEIRAIAYSLWEGEGRPGGQSAEHWKRAEAQWDQDPARVAVAVKRPSKPGPGSAPRRPTAARAKKPS